MPKGVLRKIGFYPLIATLELYFDAKDCTVLQLLPNLGQKSPKGTTNIRNFLLASALFVCLALTTTASAQDNERNYEQGTVWTAGYIETKPGYFNAYMNNLENHWLQFIKAQQ